MYKKILAEKVAAIVMWKKLACNNYLSSKYVFCVMQADTLLSCPQTVEITSLK